VTRRRHAELEMRRQSLLIDSLSDGILAIGLDGTILDWNAAAESMLGWTKAEALGRRPGELLFPGSRMDVFTAEVLRRASRGERYAEERRLRRKDGSEIFVEVLAVPLRDPDGQEVASVAVLRDVDERRRIAAQLQVAERLASLGTLAAGVAHEINNPLAFIGANLSWVRSRLAQSAQAIGPKWGDVESALTDCQEGAERIRTIVQDLKTYSAGEQRTESGPVDVNAVLEFALRMADNEIRHRARLVRKLQAVPRVAGGHSRLGQVFLNLLVNAAQAIPTGRIAENEIRIRSRYEADEQRVVVEVEDTGAGISAEDLPRIFDPFFTTKPVGVGTGLGLFICHGIITSLGGAISVDSKAGTGTAFRVSLPVASIPTLGVRPASCRILFADDEPLLGPSLQRFLSGRHEVVALTDPREALRRVAAGEHFDLALLDIAMPEMSGLDLHDRLREIDPDLARRTIFVHGGAPDAATQARLDAANAPRVAKPFDLERLGALIEAMLRDGRA
jgi:PAS domain S-box-containing protein